MSKLEIGFIVILSSIITYFVYPNIISKTEEIDKPNNVTTELFKGDIDIKYFRDKHNICYARVSTWIDGQSPIISNTSVPCDKVPELN